MIDNALASCNGLVQEVWYCLQEPFIASQARSWVLERFPQGSLSRVLIRGSVYPRLQMTVALFLQELHGPSP